MTFGHWCPVVEKINANKEPRRKQRGILKITL